MRRVRLHIAPDHRHALGVHRVLRRGRALLRNVGEIGALHKSPRLRVVYGVHHQRFTGERIYFPMYFAQGGGVGLCRTLCSYRDIPRTASLQKTFSTRDQFDQVLVGLSRRVAECHHAMKGEHQSDGVRGAPCVKHVHAGARQRMAGMMIRHQRRDIAVYLGMHGVDVFDIRHRQHRIGVRVFDKTKRQSCMHQGFDGRPRGRSARKTRIKRAHHADVAEILLLQHLHRRVEPQRCERGFIYLCEVAAGAFDVQHARATLINFHRSIAAAVQHQCGVAAQQPRAIGAQREFAVALCRMRHVPPAFHVLIIIGGMENKDAFMVGRATWVADNVALAAIRREVFVVEQRVPESEEWDDRDAVSEHVIARASDGKAIGTGRLLPDGYIGRMAVLKPWRGRGVGSALLSELIAMARERGFAETRLHAQTHALAFYRKHGYTPLGDEFMEAGIPHYEMRLVLKP